MQPDSNGHIAGPGIHVQPTADVDERAELGVGTRVWHLAQIRENAQIGRGCIIGRGAYVGPGWSWGTTSSCRTTPSSMNRPAWRTPSLIGPSAVLTNDVSYLNIQDKRKVNHFI